MKNKILIFIFLLNIIKNNNEELKNKRNLISDEQKKNLCFNFNDYEINNEYSSIKEYINSLKIKKKNGKPFILKLMLNEKQESKNLENFSIDIGYYIFFICLSVVFIIGKNII